MRHDVRFTDTLVELVNTEDWTDVYHFTSHATKRVLRHALERVQEVLDPLKDSISVRHPVIVCVLSDGWTRLFRDSADRSRYWRCRLDFKMHHSITVQNVVQRLRKLAASKFSMSPKAVTYICWSI